MKKYMDPSFNIPEDKGKICPNCKDGSLCFMKEESVYSPDHYQCDKCDSTYNVSEIENEE